METNKNRITGLNFVCRSLNPLNVEFHRKRLTQPQGIFMIFKTLNLGCRNSMTKHLSCYIKQRLRGLFASITNSCNQLLPLPKLLHYRTKFRVSVGVQASTKNQTYWGGCRETDTHAPRSCIILPFIYSYKLMFILCTPPNRKCILPIQKHFCFICKTSCFWIKQYIYILT